MPKSFKKIGVLLAAVAMLSQGITVSAEGMAEIALNVTSIKGNDIDIVCDIKGGESITNGKLRINYNPEQIELSEKAQKGEAAGNAMVVINDPVSGASGANPKTDEIVVAFAGSEEIKGEGTLVDMRFIAKDALNAGDEIEISVVSEGMNGNSGSVDIKTHNLTYTYNEDKESGNNDGNSTGGAMDNENQDNHGEENTDVTEKKEENNDPSIDTGKKAEKNMADKASAGSKTTKAGNVHTGDHANIVVPAVLCLTAIIAIVSILTFKRRTRRNTMFRYKDTEL